MGQQSPAPDAEPGLKIRPARAEDAKAIAKLLGELGYPTPVEEVPSRLAGYETPDYVALIAETRGEVVALIGLHVLSSLHVGNPACYITGLIVTETAQHQGIGKQLLAEAETWARAHGCNRITVTSANHREDAHAFYETHGFPQTGRRFVKTL